MTLTNARTNPLRQALDYGQSIWYDGLIAKGHFEKMIAEDGLRGATTNPTIFEKELAESKYDAIIRDMGRASSEAEIFKTLAVRAVQDISETFQGVHESSKGEDGFVSIEVSPLLARETEGTVREARELHERIGRKNIMIKIPATKEGLPAIETVIADGISVNVTLIFSIERHREVMDAYLRGLERREAAGKTLCGIASVASFFVSRVDTAVDKLLEERIAAAAPAEKQTLRALAGKIGIANSKLAYRAFEETFGGGRFAKLKEKGALAQRPLWASTGTKNPAYSDVVYVEALMGPRTVNTVPPSTLDAFRDHGRPAARLKQGTEEAAAQVAALARHGISLDAVTAELEEAGVRSFADSYRKIMQTIGAKKP